MSERRKRRKSHPILKGIGSLIVIGALLLLSTYAIRYCMGLFVVGDEYIMSPPGETMPVADNTQESDVQPTQSDVVVEIARANILATGDLMMHLPIVRSGLSGGEYSYSYIYSYISPYVNKADYAVINLETTLSGTDGKEYTGYPKFNSPDAVASGAKSGGFDLMLTANNHCNDYGTAGLKRTLEIVRNAGLETTGTRLSTEEQQYLVKEIGGIKVGMINYTYGDIGDDTSRPSINGLPTDSAASGLINAFDYDKLDMFYTEMENHIAGMRAAGAEAIVLFIHWGDEYTTKVNSNQKAIAQKMCDLGVDVIAGSHPHVVQTMDLLTSTVDTAHQTVCVYSMGNFLSNQRSNNISLTTGESEDSLLFSFTFVKYSNGEVLLDSVDIQPTWVLIRGSGDGRSYHILPLDYDVEDWKTAYDLTATQSENARESYNRTMNIIGTDFNRVTGILQEQKAARDGIFLEPGVG